MFIQQDRIDDTGPVSARQQPNSTFPVMAIDRFLESWASSFNHRQVAVEDEMQPLQQVEIDRRRHRNDETVVGEMTMTEWQYETFAGDTVWNQRAGRTADCDFCPADPHAPDGYLTD